MPSLHLFETSDANDERQNNDKNNRKIKCKKRRQKIP